MHRKDIVLVSAPPGWQKTLPIGLGFLAAYLRKKGFSSIICDMAVDISGKIQKEDYDYLWGLKAKNIWLNSDVLRLFIEKYEKEIQDYVEYILSFKTKAIGFSVIHSKQLITLELIRRIKDKDPSVAIILGGPACFYDEDRYVLESPGTIDIFVLGEGEETLYEVLTCISKNRQFDDIKGIRARSADYKKYIPRSSIDDLDILPFPEYPGLDFKDYSSAPVPLFWSRGCFGNCSFCEIKNIWPSYKVRSAENIFKEIKFYVEEKNISRFSIFDSVANGKPEALERVCDSIIQSGYKIHWEANVISLSSMNERIYKKMKAAGCAVLYFGIETGSERILKMMRKPFTVSQAERNIHLAHDAGIEISLNFITGFPGEDEMHFQDTMNFAQRNSRWIDRVDFITECQVARGTDLFFHPDKYGIIIPDNWEGYKWSTKDGENDLRIRQERTLRLGKHLESLSVKINPKFNLDDGSQDIVSQISKNLKKDVKQNLVHLGDSLDFPKYLSIQTTSLCNASCIFCPYKDIRSNFPNKVMDKDLYKKIIDECSDYKTMERIILYMNNEPLTDPHLIDRINYAKERIPWASVHIITNGLLLTKETTEKLIDSKLDWIGISFHGIKKKTIESAMGIPFDVTLKRINNFIKRAASKKTINEYIMTTFLKHQHLTKKEKEEAIDYWRGKGIRRISYFDGPVSRAGNVKDLPKVYHKEKIMGCKSIWADEMLHVVEDGKVVLCCMDWRREVILGDLNRESIHSVWNGKRKETWKKISGRKKMPDDFICKRCEEAMLDNRIVLDVNNPDILLVNLPPWGVETPPLGSACLSAYLETNDIKTKVFDMNIKLYNSVPKEFRYLWSMNYSHLWRQEKEFLKIYKAIKPYITSFFEEILNINSNVIAFSLPTNCSDLILKEIVKEIKNKHPSKVIILGGVSISIQEQRHDLIRQLGSYIDYCVIGEGEEGLARLMSAILGKQHESIKYIKGVLDRDSFLKDTSPLFVRELDDLPSPAFTQFNLEEYEVPRSVIMEFSRGCIGKCPFCDFKSTSLFFRSKSALHIYQQIRFYKEKYNIKHITVCDAAVNGNMKVLEELCDLLIEQNLSVDLSALAIPRKEMTKELLIKMRKAGFYRLEYGVESGSDKILKAMRKIFTRKTAERVLENTYNAGIKTLIYLIVGYPGETEEDFDETKEFLIRSARYISMIKSINPLYIMAGSEIHSNLQRYNIVLPYVNGDREWRIGDKNTSVSRKKRVLELKVLAKKLGISFTEEGESIEYTLDQLDRNKTTKKMIKHAEILLLVCPMWDISLPPLGIGYLVSYLKSKNIAVDVFNVNIDTYASSTPKARDLWKMENYRLCNDRKLFESHVLPLFDNRIDDYVNKILSQNINILGFSVNAANLLFSIELARRIKDKDPHKIIIFGGPHSRWFETDIDHLEKHRDVYRGFYPGLVDIFVIGEGEKSLAEIVECYRNNTALDSIPGIIVYKDNKYILHKGDNSILNVDGLPYPDFTWIDFLKYTNRLLPILLSRGCIRKCAFCNDTFVSSRYRCRSAENVLGEIKSRLENEKINNFMFNDLILNGNLSELEKLCDLLIKNKVDIRYTGQFGVRKDMERRLLLKLKKSGCEAITYGVESFSNKVLKLMRKPYTCAEAQKVLKDTTKAGIDTHINVVVGFPGEGKDEFRENIEEIKSSCKYIKGISSLAPCLITLGSDLQMNFKKYNIVFPETERADAYFRWYTEDGNNYNLRKERVKIIESIMLESGLSTSIVNLYDREDEEKPPQVFVPKTEPRLSVDFLLINLPPWAQENPHIGIGYLSAYLRSKGINFKMLDLNKRFFINHPDFQRLWHAENKNFWSSEHTFPLIREIFKEDIHTAVKEVLSFDCNILGFSVVDPKERLTIEFIKRIKEKSPDKKIILGGPATSTYEQRKTFLDSIDKYLDIFVIGEGEETLFSLLDRSLRKKDITGIEGCFVRDNGSWSYKEKTTLVPLDQIPFPTYEEFDLNLYGKSLLVEWSRGCRGKCAFCKNYRLFSAYRAKSPDRIMSELRYHKERHNIDEFTVTDSILNGDLKKLREVCNEIVSQNLKIRWTGQIAPHRNMDFDFFRSMKKAGCFKLQIGLESGSNHVLRAMQKTFTAEVSEKNIRLAKKAGIETEIFVMIGFPSETEKDFKETFNFIKRNTSHIDTIKSINTLHLIAGTDVYENRQRFKIKPLPERDWHYLWETYDGNKYEVRKERAQRLVDLSYGLGLKVMETNIQEGKESIFEQIKDRKDLSKGAVLLKDSVDNLQALPQKRRLVRKRRGILRWIVAIFLSLYAFLYIVYFWLYMGLRNKALLGGRKKLEKD